MSKEIEISKKLFNQFKKQAKHEGIEIADVIRNKYHSPDRILIFYRDEDKIYKKTPLAEKIQISQQEFDLYEAVNDMVITIRHASETRKTHERV